MKKFNEWLKIRETGTFAGAPVAGNPYASTGDIAPYPQVLGAGSSKEKKKKIIKRPNKINESFQQIDDSQITQIYKKAHIALELAQKYMTNLMKNISMVANLTNPQLQHKAYGAYTSIQASGIGIANKNQKVNSKDLPEELIRKEYPDINPNFLQKGEVIRINIKKLLKDHDPKKTNEIELIKQIACTIVHEATHAAGHKDEIVPKQNEEKLMKMLNDQEIINMMRKYPESNIPKFKI